MATLTPDQMTSLANDVLHHVGQIDSGYCLERYNALPFLNKNRLLCLPVDREFLPITITSDTDFVKMMPISPYKIVDSIRLRLSKHLWLTLVELEAMFGKRSPFLWRMAVARGWWLNTKCWQDNSRTIFTTTSFVKFIPEPWPISLPLVYLTSRS